MAAAGWTVYGALFDVAVPPAVFVAGCLAALWIVIDAYAMWRDWRQARTAN